MLLAILFVIPLKDLLNISKNYVSSAFLINYFSRSKGITDVNK